MKILCFGIPLEYHRTQNVPQMKIFSTLIVGILWFSTASAKNITSSVEITNTTVIPSTTLSTGDNENTVVLNWTATNEKSNVRYEIERSFYSNNFSSIATLVIPYANDEENSYSISDKAAELTGRAVAYYRIKQIAKDGSVIYSNVKVVSLKETNSNKIQSNNNISFSAVQNGKALVTIKTVTGTITKIINTIAAKGNNTVKVSAENGIEKGMYVTEVTINGELVATQKIIIE